MSDLCLSWNWINIMGSVISGHSVSWSVILIMIQYLQEITSSNVYVTSAENVFLHHWIQFSLTENEWVKMNGFSVDSIRVVTDKRNSITDTNCYLLIRTAKTKFGSNCSFIVSFSHGETVSVCVDVCLYIYVCCKCEIICYLWMELWKLIN